MQTIRTVGCAICNKIDAAMNSTIVWYRTDEFAKEGLAIALIGLCALPFIFS